MKQFKLIACLLSLVWFAGCNEEECKGWEKIPFFDGKEQAIEELKEITCFYEMSYYCEVADTEYMFFCYADDAEEWYSIPELIADKDSDGEISREEYEDWENYVYHVLADLNKDGEVDLDESRQIDKRLRHYAQYVFGISKADYIKLGGKKIRQGEKLVMTIDLTDVRGRIRTVTCDGRELMLANLIGSSHMGPYTASNLRKAYLKKIH